MVETPLPRSRADDGPRIVTHICLQSRTTYRAGVDRTSWGRGRGGPGSFGRASRPAECQPADGVLRSSVRLVSLDSGASPRARERGGLGRGKLFVARFAVIAREVSDRRRRLSRLGTSGASALNASCAAAAVKDRRLTKVLRAAGNLSSHGARSESRSSGIPTGLEVDLKLLCLGADRARIDFPPAYPAPDGSVLVSVR